MGCPGGLSAPLQSPSGRARGHPTAEWEGTRGLGHWPAAGRPRGHWATLRGPDRLQECTTACPARPSAPAGREPLLGSREAALETWESARREPSAPASLPAPPGPRGESRTSGARADGRARARALRPPGRPARAAPARPWVTWSHGLRLLPAPPPFPPSGFLSFLSFLSSFFSMNTHRVHLKATLPHFTAAVGF